MNSFITAPNSRDKLSITKKMAQKVFSYLQVMPEFLDCMLPFGLRECSLDCYSTSFQASNCDDQSTYGLQIDALGRSGRQMEHCYGLRSVERSPSQADWPWSIRPCSIYHSLDFETGSSSWIIVKANRLIQKLVHDAYGSQSHRTPPSEYAPARSVVEAMEIHRLIATWCVNTWPQYVGFLESSLQEVTRPTLNATLAVEQVLLFDPQASDETSTCTPAGLVQGLEWGENQHPREQSDHLCAHSHGECRHSGMRVVQRQMLAWRKPYQ